MVALLPWVAAVLLVAWQFVLAGDARASAAVAARAAARAVAVGDDPAVAARERFRAGCGSGFGSSAAPDGVVSVSVRVPALAGPLDLGRVAARPGWGRPVSAERGQATVELAALLPLLAVVALAAYALLAGLSAGEQAGVAAEAGRSPAAGPRCARLPRGQRCLVLCDARPCRGPRPRVTVAVRPRVPLVARLLRSRVSADAGPEPAP